LGDDLLAWVIMQLVIEVKMTDLFGPYH
jgi:hypothetical protein